MNQPVNLQDRRQERAVQQIRTKLVVEVLIGGKWIASEFELSPAQAAAIAPPAPQSQPEPKKMAQPMTFGRDPGKHLITFGRFFKENDSKAITIAAAADQHGLHELYDYWEYASKQEDPSAGLEVLKEMLEAFLLERQYDPKSRPEKYKTPRRQK
jgi:hypothetical protein